MQTQVTCKRHPRSTSQKGPKLNKPPPRQKHNNHLRAQNGSIQNQTDNSSKGSMFGKLIGNPVEPPLNLILSVHKPIKLGDQTTP